MRQHLKISLISALFILFTSAASAQVYNITKFGAVGDSKTINTKAIQSAINQCSKNGGQVLIPKGTFLSGTLYLKNNTHIQIEEGAVLKGSSSFADYPDNEISYKNSFSHDKSGKTRVSKAFLFAEGVSGITLSGKGTINGNGDSEEFNLGNDSGSPKSRQRPCMLLFINSKNISVSDLHLTNSAYWLQNYLGCENLHLKGLKIYNHSNYNQDGMDIDARNVLIENCELDVDDDGICFKNHERANIVENVVVRNCKIASNCNAIKFGTMSVGGLKNVKITDCVITAASADHIRKWQKQLKFIELPSTVLAGIALESVDGAIVDNVQISNIVMTGVQTPIFIVLGNKGRGGIGNEKPSQVGQIKNVSISNITATSHSKMPSSITAMPGYYIEHVKLSKITISSMGKGTVAEAAIALKENTKAYPENRMYGEVYPASGFYIRHAKGVVIKDLTLDVRNPDYRPSIVLDDVFDSSLHRLSVKAPAGTGAPVSLVKSDGIKISSPAYSSDQKSPLVQVVDGEEKHVTVKGFKKYSGWLITGLAQ